MSSSNPNWGKWAESSEQLTSFESMGGNRIFYGFSILILICREIWSVHIGSKLKKTPKPRLFRVGVLEDAMSCQFSRCAFHFRSFPLSPSVSLLLDHEDIVGESGRLCVIGLTISDHTLFFSQRRRTFSLFFGRVCTLFSFSPPG